MEILTTETVTQCLALPHSRHRGAVWSPENWSLAAALSLHSPELHRIGNLLLCSKRLPCCSRCRLELLGPGACCCVAVGLLPPWQRSLSREPCRRRPPVAATSPACKDKREWDRLEFAAAPKFGDQHLLELARVRTAAKSIQDPAHESALWEAHQVPYKSRPYKPNCSWSHSGPSPSAVGDLCTTTYLVHPVSCSYLPTPLNGPWVKISPDLILRLPNVKKSYPVFYL